MGSHGRSERSAKRSQREDERNMTEITDEELKKIIQKVGRPWHRRKRRISVKRVKSLREQGFSLRQIARWYDVSEATIRRRLKG
jgi:DNA-directed RNA polymerase specialized sigma subunit